MDRLRYRGVVLRSPPPPSKRHWFGIDGELVRDKIKNKNKNYVQLVPEQKINYDRLLTLKCKFVFTVAVGACVYITRFEKKKVLPLYSSRVDTHYMRVYTFSAVARPKCASVIYFPAAEIVAHTGTRLSRHFNFTHFAGIRRPSTKGDTTRVTTTVRYSYTIRVITGMYAFI